MPDMSAIATALSSLNAAKDIAQAMIALRDREAFQSKLLEFQSKLLDANSAAFAAQDERSALLESIRNLEKEVASLEAWDAEKQRYELKDVGLGTLAYVVKESMRGAEPPHQICAACYQHRKKSILQPCEINHDNLLICPECKTQIKIGFVSWNPVIA
jgi:predicted P-loop ATPase